MITCPTCASPAVGGIWEQDLTRAVWECECGHRWPVAEGDSVPADVAAKIEREKAAHEWIERFRRGEVEFGPGMFIDEFKK
jgi:hypothetical protein